MKLVGSLYQDIIGRYWLVKQEVLPKKKGEYKFWTAELISTINVGEKGARDDKKGDLLKKIETL